MSLRRPVTTIAVHPARFVTVHSRRSVTGTLTRAFPTIDRRSIAGQPAAVAARTARGGHRGMRAVAVPGAGHSVLDRQLIVGVTAIDDRDRLEGTSAMSVLRVVSVVCAMPAVPGLGENER